MAETTILDSNVATRDEISTLAGGVIPVWDTTIADHANAATAGSIAWALAKANTAGSGKVVVGPGTFTLTSGPVTVLKNVSLEGAGMGSTIIDQTSATDHGVVQQILDNKFSSLICDFSVIMPATAAALTSGVYVEGVGPSQRNIQVAGGSTSSYGFTYDNFYNVQADHLIVGGQPAALSADSHGFRFTNDQNNIRPGDCVFNGLQAGLLASANGFVFDWIEANFPEQGKVGNLLFNQPWCVKWDTSDLGIGFDFRKWANRITLIRSDAENFATAYEINAFCESIELISPAESDCPTPLTNNAGLNDLFIYGNHATMGTYQTMTASGAIGEHRTHVDLHHTTVAIAATIANTAKHYKAQLHIAAISEPGAGQDHTVVITTGTFDGTNQTATFQDINDTLVVQFDKAGKGTVLINTGVTLSA